MCHGSLGPVMFPGDEANMRGWDLFGIMCFWLKGHCAVQGRVDELWRGFPGPCPLPLSLNSLASPHSFQLTVEMFDYMDCELKLSESGEPGGIRCGNLETLGIRGASVSQTRLTFHSCMHCPRGPSRTAATSHYTCGQAPVQAALL